MKTKMLKKIISGGQTGVDRAALDAALLKNFPCGGFCPKGRLAEDGAISEKYPLLELKSKQYPARTKKNIVISDATLVITYEEPDGGTALTIDLCKSLKKPLFVLILKNEKTPQIKNMHNWLKTNQVETLNIAGPRESKEPGIYKQAKELLLEQLF